MAAITVAIVALAACGSSNKPAAAAPTSSPAPAPAPVVASQTCDAAGGKCVGLTPSACTSGNIGDASKYSCGGGVGVECCLP